MAFLPFYRGGNEMLRNIENFRRSIRPLSLKEIRDLLESSLIKNETDQPLTPDELTLLTEKTLSFVFPEGAWNDLPLLDARDLTLSIFRMTFQKGSSQTQRRQLH